MKTRELSKRRRPRPVRRLGRAMPVAPILLAVGLFACSEPPAEEPSASAALVDEVGRAFWQLEVGESLLLQIWEGVEATRLPDLGREHAEQYSAAARKLLGRLAAVDPGELVPGHHFEVALLQENDALPAYRRGSWHGGFTEGWGEYASMLAADMGMYRDPYDLYGRLADERFYACRLVVDTGMNSLGWSRQQAIALMRENTLESDTQIATETLRYGVDIPGQALSYALGSLKILELRERARKALGERFDVRRFHDAVLGYGSMPLFVLEKHIDWFIEQESRRAL